MTLRHVPFLLAAVLLIMVGCQTTADVADEPVEEEERPPSAQEIGYEADARFLRQFDEFLEERGKLEHANQIDSLLTARRFGSQAPTTPDSLEIRERAYHLAMDGLTLEDVAELQNEGVDVLGMDWQRQREGQAATSEIVLRGRVLAHQDERDLEDGFRSSVYIQIENLYKGTLPFYEGPGDIAIRRESGTSLGGRHIVQRSELDLQPGTSYIFFLSHTLYEFHWLHPDERFVTAEERRERWYEALGQQVPSYCVDRLRGEEPVTRWGEDMQEEATQQALDDCPDQPVPGHVVERYPGVRLEWLHDETRDELLQRIQMITALTQN